VPTRRQPQLADRADRAELGEINGVPLVPYTYRAPRPRFAVEAIRRAETAHGTPPADDTRHGPLPGPDTQAVLEAVLSAPGGIRAADLADLHPHATGRLQRLAGQQVVRVLETIGS
jgi:hypothetical protein